MLNMLFTGMAINRLWQGMARSASAMFKTLAGSSLESAKRVNMLSAGFEFLKFRIFDTVASSDVFSSFVETMLISFEKISDFISENEGIGDFMISSFSIAVVAGTALSTGAFLVQVGKIFGGIGAVTVGQQLVKGLVSIGTALVLAMTIKSILDIVNDTKDGDNKNKLYKLIGSVLALTGTVIAKFNPALGALVVSMGLLIYFSDVDFLMGKAKDIDKSFQIKSLEKQIKINSFVDKIFNGGEDSDMTQRLKGELEELTKVDEKVLKIEKAWKDASTSQDKFTKALNIATTQSIAPDLIDTQGEIKNINDGLTTSTEKLAKLTDEEHVVQVRINYTQSGNSGGYGFSSAYESSNSPSDTTTTP
jgi:hypothetical protein